MPGPYIYAKVDELDGKDKCGTKQCAVLVQQYAGAPVTSQWKEGDKVRDNKTIKKGTAIATFVDGKYPNKSHGNHAALYVSQDAEGLYVMDQWTDDTSKPTISKRLLRFKGLSSDKKTYADPSNNGDAMSVIM